MAMTAPFPYGRTDNADPLLLFDLFPERRHQQVPCHRGLIVSSRLPRRFSPSAWAASLTPAYLGHLQGCSLAICLAVRDLPSVHPRVLCPRRTYQIFYRPAACSDPPELILAFSSNRWPSIVSLQTPIVMVGSTYKAGEYTASDKGDTSVTMTLEQLLPMSFGPEALGKDRV